MRSLKICGAAGIALAVSACASTPGKVSLIPHGSGPMGVGEALDKNIYVVMGGQRYSGTFTTVRDANFVTSSSGTVDSNATVRASGSGGIATATGQQQTAVTSRSEITSNTGSGIANLQNETGDRIRCEFRISGGWGTASGIGLCTDNQGRSYDLQIQ